MDEKAYIEREKIWSALNSACVPYNRATAKAIESIPAADVRPVVRCKDCEHFFDVMYGGTQFEYGFCDRWADGTRMNPDDFCSRGEKREES